MSAGSICACAADIINDVRSKEAGNIADWVAVFTYVWENPKERLERLLALLSDNVILTAPTKPPVTKGKEAARAAFQRVFRALPDLRADIQRWSATDDALFIEMVFHATIDGQIVSWRNVDRFVFKDGIATERVAFFDASKLRKTY